jgi:putative ABC transport system substrate-binding protein
MKRRAFIRALGGAAASWPFAARTQQAGKVWRIGALSGAARPAVLETSPYGGFLQGLRELGYVEGRDFIVEWRFAEAKPERYTEFAAELVRLKVDIFLAAAPEAVRYFQKAGPQIPIVLALSTDPVGNGFAASLAHPGGNITGLANSMDDSTPKQLELLSAAVPNLSRLGVLANSSSPNFASVAKNLTAATQTKGVSLVMADARAAEEFDGAFALLLRENVQAIMLASNVLFNLNRQRIAEFTTKNRLPSMFAVREYVEAGGLMSYGPRLSEAYHNVGVYAGRILKGATPAELPIQLPQKSEFVLNLRTAKALGLAIPPLLLARTDDAIE